VAATGPRPKESCLLLVGVVSHAAFLERWQPFLGSAARLFCGMKDTTFAASEIYCYYCYSTVEKKQAS